MNQGAAFKFLRLPPKEREEFYKFKFEYFKKFNRNAVSICVVLSMLYFVSDCQGVDGISWSTILPRFSIALPFVVYLVLYSRLRSYKVKVILSHVMTHLILWNVVWAIHYIDDRTYIYAGFITIDFVILMVGFASTFTTIVCSQCAVLAELALSNLLLSYDDIGMILATNAPFCMGIILVQFILTETLYEFYVDKTTLERLSYTDQLTGAFNRNKLRELSHSDFLAVDGYDHTSIAILDIDFFKKVNDTYGHDVGDEVLKKLTKIVSREIEEPCTLIRWGGEEFLIIMFGFGEREAYRKCNEIRRKVEESDESVAITISVGVAEVDAEEYKKIIIKADEALYHSKENGRNQVTCYSSLQGVEVSIN